MFSNLPVEMQVKIILLLSPYEATMLSVCSNELYKVVQDERIWKEFTIKRFDNSISFFSYPAITAWKQLFKQKRSIDETILQCIIYADQRLITTIFLDALAEIINIFQKEPAKVSLFCTYRDFDGDHQLNFFELAALLNSTKILEFFLTLKKQVPWAFKVPDYIKAFLLAAKNGSLEALNVLWNSATLEVKIDMLSASKRKFLHAVDTNHPLKIINAINTYAAEINRPDLRHETIQAIDHRPVPINFEI